MIASAALLPQSASTLAPEVDAITIGLLVICGAMAVFIFTLILFFGARDRKGSPHSRKINLAGEDLLEWGWTAATIVVFLGLFALGIRHLLQDASRATRRL